MHPSPLPAGRRLLGGCALALAALTACAGGQKKPTVVYPSPPDTPRIAWVRSFTTPKDLRTSGSQRFFDAILPHESAQALVSPTGIALSPDERRLYVASTTRARLMVVDLKTGEFDDMGATGDDALKLPVGVAVDATGSVYVADKGLDAVLVFDAKGKVVRAVGKGLLVHPTGLALDRRRQVLYVVNDAVTAAGKHSVEAFSLAGVHLRTLGGRPSDEAGYFHFPSQLAVSASGELWVSDMLNFRVQVFDPDGGLVRMFGSQGPGTGLFDKIQGIAFDSFRNVYVVDTLKGVQIFNDRDQPLMSFGRGVTQVPLGIVIDSRNHIYVTDYTNVVHEFELINTKAGDSYLPPPGGTQPPPSTGGASPPG